MGVEGKTKNLLQKEFPELIFLDLPGYGTRYSRAGWALPLSLLVQVPKILSTIKKERSWVQHTVDAYGVDWVVVLRPGPGETDPLNLWDGASGTDSQGEHPSFLPDEPAFEGDDVRIFRVIEG